jgi:lipoyl(octanoyl) transferase
VAWRVLDTRPADGAWNMAVDEALLEQVRAGGGPLIRFYRWTPACLSLGRNQPAAGEYDPAILGERGVDVVRRPTGGRAVLHHRELTYSAVFPDGLLGSPQAAYASINRGLVQGLRTLGVPAQLASTLGAPPPVPSLAPCFREPAEGEVVIAGRKLVGSAQLREGGVTLQHGSLLLHDDQAEVALLSRQPADEERAPAVLADFLDPLPDWDSLTRALRAGLATALRVPIPAAPSPLPEPVATRANVLQARYRDLAWTWRR